MPAGFNFFSTAYGGIFVRIKSFPLSIAVSSPSRGSPASISPRHSQNSPADPPLRPSWQIQPAWMGGQAKARVAGHPFVSFSFRFQGLYATAEGGGRLRN